MRLARQSVVIFMASVVVLSLAGLLHGQDEQYANRAVSPHPENSWFARISTPCNVVLVRLLLASKQGEINMVPIPTKQEFGGGHSCYYIYVGKATYEVSPVENSTAPFVPVGQNSYYEHKSLLGRSQEVSFNHILFGPFASESDAATFVSNLKTLLFSDQCVRSYINYSDVDVMGRDEGNIGNVVLSPADYGTSYLEALMRSTGTYQKYMERHELLDSSCDCVAQENVQASKATPATIGELIQKNVKILLLILLGECVISFLLFLLLMKAFGVQASLPLVFMVFAITPIIHHASMVIPILGHIVTTIILSLIYGSVFSKTKSGARLGCVGGFFIFGFRIILHYVISVIAVMLFMAQLFSDLRKLLNL